MLAVCSSAQGKSCFTFDASAVDFGRPGVTGVAMRQPADVGSQHGVYVTDDQGRVYAFLQKPSVGEIRAAGGLLLEYDNVAVDSGLLRFHPDVAAALTQIALQPHPTPALDLYLHITMALTGQWKSHHGRMDRAYNPSPPRWMEFRSHAACLMHVPSSRHYARLPCRSHCRRTTMEVLHRNGTLRRPSRRYR